MIGETLRGRYQIEAKIGEGAMGQVYRAVDSQSGDFVAIKRIGKDLSEDENYRKRFSREAAALSKLSHPNIVGYIEAFSFDGAGYLVTEFYGGGDLRKLIQSQKQLPEGKFKDIALKIIDAVATAHRVGIIHRDLKPENVLMSATGEPKVADFGLARDQNLSTMTATGSVMGTLAYMPPEAFDAFVRQDHRGDIWAIGVMMFEMLTGGLPFRARSQSEMIAAILSDKILNLTHVRRDVPVAWGYIIEKCLAKELSERYQSADDLFSDLRSDRLGVAPKPQAIEDAGESGLRFLTPTLEGKPAIRPLKSPNPNNLMFLTDDYVPAIEPVLSPRTKKDFTRPLPPLDNAPPVGKGLPIWVLLGSLFVWSGISLTIFCAIVMILLFTQTEESVGVTIEQLTIFQSLGALLFSFGLFVETFMETGWRIFALLGMAIICAGMWILFFSRLLVPDTGHVMGMAGYSLMMLFYVQLKH